MFPVLAHRSALPWCCYEKKNGRIALRVLASEDVQTVVLLWGDPYDWYNAGTVSQWRFTETEMFQQFSGISPTTWKITFELPPFRRLKYGFKVKTVGGDFYFSENGVEPYSAAAINRPHNHFFYPFIHEIDAPQPPEWVETTVWYEIFPDRFCRGNGGAALPPEKTENWERGAPSNRNFFGGNLAGIREKLPYLADLGITGIYLTPIFQSPSNHKYNTEDYFACDRHFGDVSDLKALVDDAHRLGIRVMLDAVFNHAGETHPFWQDVLKNQEASPYRDYFHIRRFPVRQTGAAPTRDLDFHTFAWSPQMPKWNTEHPAARQYLLDAAAYWIRECAIDGWRLDVANEVSFDFWQDFSRLVRSLKPDLYIVGEIWHDASPWVNAGLFDAVMNYPLQYAISAFFLKKETGSEEFTRRLAAALTRYSDLHNRAAFNLLDSHDTDRALTRANGDKQALKNAVTMLFLLPGSPCLFYGTETGMEGGGDPDCRRPMIWDEARQDLELRRFFQDVIKLRRRFFHIISNSVIHYKKRENINFWEFLNSGERLIAVYAEGTAVQDFEAPGERVAGPETPVNEAGELPPGVLFVYYRRDS